MHLGEFDIKRTAGFNRYPPDTMVQKIDYVDSYRHCNTDWT
jgi:hypothetical protein